MQIATTAGRSLAGMQLLPTLTACAFLAACTAESTHNPAASLTPLSPAVAAAPSSSVATQAFVAEKESKVELAARSVSAGAAGRISSTSGRASNEKPGFDLFKTLQENNRRAGKVRAAQSAARPRTEVTAAKRSISNSKRQKMAALPGVRTDKSLTAVKAISRAASTTAKTLAKPVRVASAAALSRIGRHGLRTQHSKVSISCLQPRLVKLIKRAERHFGRHAVVTSGYRSPRHNRRIGGARKSMHVSCQAADIQIKGVSKWKLASWLRKQDGRGGVGTYCHTQSVHLDTGKIRDWNWRCKRSRKRRRRA